MSDVSSSVIGGRLGADVQERITPNGKTLYTFSLANSRTFKSGGEKKETTSWYNVSAFEGTAAGIKNYLVKGKKVTVVGRVEVRDYTDKEGNQRRSVDLIANEIILGDNRVEGSAGATASESWDDDATDDIPF